MEEEEIFLNSFCEARFHTKTRQRLHKRGSYRPRTLINTNTKTKKKNPQQNTTKWNLALQ